MSLEVPKNQQKQRELPPKGLQHARCIRIIDLGTQDTVFNGEPKKTPQVKFTFELVNHMFVFDEKKGPEPFVVSQTHTASLSDKSNMYAMLKNWNEKVTEALAAGAESVKLSTFIGQPAIIKITHEKSKKNPDITYGLIGDKGRQVNNREGVEIKKSQNPHVVMDLAWMKTDPEKFKATWEQLYDYEKKTIQKSYEYREHFVNQPAAAAPQQQENGDLPEQISEDNVGF